MKILNSSPVTALIRFTAEWFDAVLATPELKNSVRQDGETIESFLHPTFHLVASWQVSSASTLEKCCNELRALDLDLVIFVYQVWAEDYFLNELVREIGNCPLLVWCYQPWKKPPRPASFMEVLRGSGPVGTFEGLGTLRNLGQEYLFVHGAPGEERLRLELERIAKAVLVRRQLQSARFGILPARNQQMQSTFVDEFRLRSEIGPKVEYLSVAELKETMDQLEPAEVDAFVAQLRKDYPIHDVQNLSLQTAARASLGLAHLSVNRDLDLISLNDIDQELHSLLGLRPCLYPDLFELSGKQVSLEGDLGAAVALFIMAKLSGAPLLFCEFWFWDEEENLIIGGHAGIQNPAAAVPGKVVLSKDFEYDQSDRLAGAHYQFVAKPGRVTLFHLRCTQNSWQAIVSSGETISCDPWIEGYPHAVIHLDPPIAYFLENVAKVGSTQHWIMAYGDYAEEVETVMQILKLPLLKI